MNQLKLNLDKHTYQQLKTKFNGNIEAMEDFAKKLLPKKLKDQILTWGKKKKKTIKTI